MNANGRALAVRSLKIQPSASGRSGAALAAGRFRFAAPLPGEGLFRELFALPAKGSIVNSFAKRFFASDIKLMEKLPIAYNRPGEHSLGGRSGA